MKAEEKSTAQLEELIDATEAARLPHIHPVTLCEFARQKRIPAVKIGRVWRFRPSRLLQWVIELEQRQNGHGDL
jgi:excisionase family DNA binding protein